MLRRKQYRIAGTESGSANLASDFLIGKIANCRTVLRRFIIDYGEKENANEISESIKLMARNVNKLRGSLALDTTQSVEGECARNFFCF